MTTLRRALGRMPRGYRSESDRKGYQVTIYGPAGTAVVTEINTGYAADHDYEVETSFRDQGLQLHHDIATPEAAMEKVVALTNARLTCLGEVPPPLRQVIPYAANVAIVVLGAVLAGLIVAGAIALFTSDNGNGAPPVAPSASITQVPQQATLYGGQRYAGSINLAPTTLEIPR
jgi:hypothetical protein